MKDATEDDDDRRICITFRIYQKKDPVCFDFMSELTKEDRRSLARYLLSRSIRQELNLRGDSSVSDLNQMSPAGARTITDSDSGITTINHTDPWMASMVKHLDESTSS